MPKKALVLHLLGQFCLGLGLGTGWVHHATQYPAIVGAALGVAGCLAILTAMLASGAKSATDPVGGTDRR